MHEREPQFLILEDPSYRSFWEALAVFWETHPPTQSIGLGRSRTWPKNHLPVPGLFSSVLLHFSVALFLLRVPFSPFLHYLPGESQAGDEHHVQQVVYVLRPVDLSVYFPSVEPGGPGGKPGQGRQPERPPVSGGTVLHPKLSIVSNPPHPDNNRQTVLQPASPPDLKIPLELRLPNVLVGAMSLPEPPKQVAAPHGGLAYAPSQSQEVSSASAAGSAPPASTLAITAPPDSVANPTLPLPPPASPSEARPESPSAKSPDRITELDIASRSTTTATSLLSISVDPIQGAESVALPPGNRRGAFSISPVAAAPGSPGGVVGTDPRGGRAGSGAAGDPSTGTGAGSVGGGGGGSTLASEGISINAAPGSKGGEGGGALPSFFAATLVHRVSPPRPRHAPMVVTAGPTGGGGLHLYGVLRGGKVYTVYLPMPSKSWILQYCAEDNLVRNGITPPRGVVVRLDPGLVPPSPEEQFDFERPPLSKGMYREMIILHGVIREDGSVSDLRVAQGLLDTVDQAAVAAFGRWRFRPALRDGKPVVVEVLVGIPALSPET